MKTIFTKTLLVNGITRVLNVLCGDIRESNDNFDLLLCSSYKHNYFPKQPTMMWSLKSVGIDVKELSTRPELIINMKKYGFWVSEECHTNLCKRIGCVELMPLGEEEPTDEEKTGIIEFVANVLSFDYLKNHYKKIALPLIGTGNMSLPVRSITPLLAKLVERCFKRNDELTEINFFGYTESNLENLIIDLKPIFEEEYDVFISHSSKDNSILFKIIDALKNNDIKTWADKTFFMGGEEFPSDIYSALRNSSTVLLILTKNADQSPWVKIEIEEAKRLNKRIIPYDCSNSLKELSIFKKHFENKIHVINSKEVDVDRLSNNVLKIVNEVNLTKKEW